MPTPPPTYDPTARLASLHAQAVAAYVRHARRPAATGADVAHLKLHAAAYEARAALAEQNPAFAQTLLPTTATPVVAGVGLPLVPAGVRWAVDEAAVGTMTLTVDVAGALVVNVQAPGGADSFAPAVQTAATRSTTTFPAVADGIYTISLLAGGVSLPTLYVAVARTEFGLFREHSRALGFGFRLTLPRPSADYLECLALLAGAEAAAQTGQVGLCARTLATLRGNPAAPSPTALYPYAPHAD